MDRTALAKPTALAEFFTGYFSPIHRGPCQQYAALTFPGTRRWSARGCVSRFSGPMGADALAGKRARRILVVDDHHDASETLAILLRAAGHEVLVAADGMSALDHAPSFDPDVIFLDIGLPGMSGLEVARRLREAKEEGGPVVVAISGYGTDLDRRRALDAGIKHYFTKPVGLDTLRDLLASLPARG